MSARKRKLRRAVSIRPQRDLIERLTRELKHKVRPEVIAQAAISFRTIISSGGR